MNPQKQTQALNTSIPAPEWSVVGGYDGEMPLPISVYHNGALVATAADDVPTYDTLYLMAKQANDHARLVAENEALRLALRDIHTKAMSLGECMQMAKVALAQSAAQGGGK